MEQAEVDADPRRLLARLISRSYVELVRNIPPLVFIFIFYFTTVLILSFLIIGI